MKIGKQRTYPQTIRWRIRVLWLVLAALVVYMIVGAAFGGGDSRVITRFGDMVGDILLFGGMVYVICRIIRNKRLLKHREEMKEQQRQELDERNRYLHEKSGGVVMDILLIALMAATMTAAYFNTVAFYTAFSLLMFALLVKLAAYLLFCRFR